MIATEISFEDFLDLRNLWNDALSRSLDNNIFLTWEWLTTWWKHYGDKRRALIIAVIEDEKIVAAAPLMYSAYNFLHMRIDRLQCLGSPNADYHAFLIGDNKPEYVRLIMDYARRAAVESDMIELSEIPEDSETARVLASLQLSLGFGLRVQNVCPYAALPAKFEDYLKSRGFNLRRNLRKSEKKARKKYTLDFKISGKPDEVKNDMAIFFDLHQKRWRSRRQIGAFADQKYRDFHLDIAKSFAERGWLILSILRFNSSPVSIGYGFVYGNKLYSYLSGLNPEFGDYRVGSLRLMFLIQYCIRRGLTEYDFLRGDEPYKEYWSTSVRKNLEFWVSRKKIVPRIYSTLTKNDALFNLIYKVNKRRALRLSV